MFESAGMSTTSPSISSRKLSLLLVITVTFPEDVSFFTEVAYLIPGHYEAGMKGVLQYG